MCMHIHECTKYNVQWNCAELNYFKIFLLIFIMFIISFRNSVVHEKFILAFVCRFFRLIACCSPIITLIKTNNLCKNHKQKHYRLYVLLIYIFTDIVFLYYYLFLNNTIIQPTFFILK